MKAINIGLEGVVVGETNISHVEGDVGNLWYQGHSIETVANWSFAKAVLLLLTGTEAPENEVVTFDRFLLSASQLSATELRLLEQLPRDLHPMLVLQAIVPVMNLNPQDALASQFNKGNLNGIVMAAKLMNVLAVWHKLTRFGKATAIDLSNVNAPIGDATIAQFLYHLSENGDINPEHLQALRVTQILQLEHGFNAGTFAGRVVASTKAPIQSAISASIGALYGVLHGGADQAALEMAIKVGDPNLANEYVTDSLARGEKIMGMGHREYKTLDPRAAILKPIALKLCLGTEHEALYNTLEAIENSCHKAFQTKGKTIWANIEFYKGAVFTVLGLPPSFFTATFACARIYGYIAHYHEYSAVSRLIRPQAIYTGQHHMVNLPQP